MGKRGGTATAILVSFLLFYFPSMLSLLSHDGEPRSWMIRGMIMGTFYTLVFCINYFWLVPATLVRTENKLLYFAANFCVIAALCCLIPFVFNLNGGTPPHKKHIELQLTTFQYVLGYFRFLLRDGIMMILSAALAYALRLSTERDKIRQRELELNAERQEIELKSLKAQLNPHFLFNCLNNIYALIGFAPDRAREALHDLSSMLRFMIYDSGASLVPLGKELRFIKDYIELAKLRLNSNVKLRVEINDNPFPSLFISPLLLITVIENAFKHVRSNGTDHFIDISITTDSEKLVCKVINSFDPNESSRQLTDSSESGVGLINVKKQLELLYPDQHDLKIDKKEGIFSIILSFELIALKNDETQMHNN